MHNLEQIRAKHAFEFIDNNDDITGSDGGNILSKIPTMIVADGFLATAAFAIAKGGGYERTINNIFQHLRSQSIASDINDLIAKDALDLQRATLEAIAYANYVKRFGKAKRKGG